MNEGDIVKLLSHTLDLIGKKKDYNYKITKALKDNQRVLVNVLHFPMKQKEFMF